MLDASLQTALTELEVERKVISSLNIKSYLFIGGGILLVALGFLLGDLVIAGAISGGILLIIGIVILSKGSEKFKAYRHSFKQRVVANVLKSVDSSLELDYQNGLSENDFKYSRLFSREPDRYESQDQVYGTAGKTRFSFSEVHAEYKTETQTKNGRKVEWHTIFKGIIFCADFNKHFKGITLISPNDMGGAIGAWFSNTLSIFSSGDRQLVKLENPEFSKCFVTYSTDQVEARYILTPSMMERLCELNSKCKYTMSMSFIDTQVFIAFPLDKDYFEPAVFKSLLTETALEEDLAVVKFMYNIIQELDLNTRIWGKE